MRKTRQRWVPAWCDGPMRLLLGVGLVVGVLFVFIAPPWSGGADEATHFARSIDIAGGHLTPRTIDDRSVSILPRSYREDQNLVVDNFYGPAPINGTLIRTLLHSTPNTSDTIAYDTNATMAATPVGYLPSAIGMAIPRALNAPGVVSLWFGRLADLLFYLFVFGLAVHVATGFRWTIAFGAIVPMNLALASSVTPDGVTIAAIALVLASFIRMWSQVTDGDHHGEIAQRVNGKTVALILGSGLLLALAKPPYFLILLLFGVLAFVARRNRTVLAAAGAAAVAMAVGAMSTALAASSNYGGVSESLADPITVQPDVQKQRLLDNPFGFLRHCVTDWFSRLNDTVQIWSRRLGIWTSGPPHFVPWLLLVSFVLAAVLFDLEWFRKFRGLLRWSVALGTIALIVVLYASSFIWFDDTTWGQHMGDQIGRYSIPLFALAVIGRIPRWTFTPLANIAEGRVTRTTASRVALVSALVCIATVVVAMLINWLSTGRG